MVGPWLVDREVSSSNPTVVIFEISKSLSEGLSFRLGGGSSLDGAGFTPTFKCRALGRLVLEVFLPSGRLVCELFGGL